MELKSEVVVKTETKEISSPSIPKLNEDAYESSQANSPNTNEEKDTKIPVQISPYQPYQQTNYQINSLPYNFHSISNSSTSSSGLFNPEDTHLPQVSTSTEDSSTALQKTLIETTTRAWNISKEKNSKFSETPTPSQSLNPFTVLSKFHQYKAHRPQTQTQQYQTDQTPQNQKICYL